MSEKQEKEKNEDIATAQSEFILCINKRCKPQLLEAAL